MYSYTFDEETGGILLNSTPTNFSKEPRPVYAKEMDILGFDEYWDYEKQNDVPYLWAESVSYWYKGKLIARIKGGDLYTKPELIPAKDDDGNIYFGKDTGESLRPIDISLMCAKNSELLSIIEDTTVKLIVKAYEKYKNKVDIFHVAFSGGKDSAVLLELTRRALPKGSFVVIFGDTGMEFPDTYKVVEVTKRLCDEEGTPFYLSQSHFTPDESWDLFGPPSRVLRWCCSVHKSTPQTIKMRELTGKNNYTGLDFVGVRHHESAARSTYEFENFGKKQKGQYSFNPILEWTSAEVWLYIFANKIYVNEAYKKGNSRAGCLLCPMSGGCSDYFRRENYTKEVDFYIDKIRKSNGWDNHSEQDMQTYITSGGWDNRRSGRGLLGNTSRYKETIDGDKIIIEILTDSSDWQEWIKTVDLRDFPYEVTKTLNGWSFEIATILTKTHPSTAKYFRQALKKASYCVGCRVCETNCKNGRLTFVDGKVKIENCIQCHECHEIPMGCYVYNSLKIPQGEKKMKSINCFDDHAPKRDWLVSFFELQDDFFEDKAGLGPNQFTHFKRFLRDAELIDGNKCSSLSSLINSIGWETEAALGIILTNLAYNNAQFEWYVQEMDIGIYYETKFLKDKLLLADMKEKAANSVVKSLKRIAETPFGTILGFCYSSDDDLVRLKCELPDAKVFLYALYRFAEKCNDYKEFHLSYLLNDTIERDGVSPVRLFGIYDEEELKSILLGLSAKYPEFINATFLNDLKSIYLRDKTSQDVLELFKKEI